MRRILPLLLIVLLLVIFVVGLIMAQPTVPLPGPRVAIELLKNGSFEQDQNKDKIPDKWKGEDLQNPRTDKRKCNRPDKPVAYSGNCAFVFRENSNGDTSLLFQKVKDYAAITDGAVLEFSAMIASGSHDPGTLFGQAIININHQYGVVLELMVPDGDRVYTRVADTAVVFLQPGETITSVRVKLYDYNYYGSAGVFALDDVSLLVVDYAPSPTPTSTKLPKPTQIYAADGEEGDRFGQSVSLGTDLAVMGAPGDDAYRGSAYVFARSGSTWSQQQKLIDPQGQAGDWFGLDVAVDASTVLVGAPSKQVSFVGEGAVFAYAQSSGVWTQQQTLVADEAGEYNNFGLTMLLNGDTVFIGAPGYNNYQGAVYVFTRTGGVWTQQQKLTAADGESGDGFGSSLAHDSSTLMVGSWFDTIAASDNQGSVYVFTCNAATCMQQQKLVASDGTANGLFGVSMGIAGNTAIIGAQGDSSDVGAAYVFEKTGETWTEQQKLLSGYTGQMGFGRTVTFGTDFVLIGTFPEHVLFMFVENQQGDWFKIREIMSPHDGDVYNFGSDVDLLNTLALIGSYTDVVDVGTGSNQGAAYLYTVR